MNNKVWQGFLTWLFLVSVLVSIAIGLGTWAIFSGRSALNDAYDPDAASTTVIEDPLYEPSVDDN